MGEERIFYKVPATVTVHCRQCKARLTEGDEYFMTDDSSWIYCPKCATSKEKPHGPKPRLYAPHEREPLHRRETLREQVERCQM